MNIKQVLKFVNYIKCLNEIDLEFNDVEIDSRIKTDMFIGIKGKNSDGNLFYMDAFKNGARICVVENITLPNDINDYLLKNNVMLIIVKSTISFLQDLAKYKRSLYNIPIIGITGSSGKTSTKDLIYNILSEKYKTLKTCENHNNYLGVPLTILKLRDHECAVIEMGMDRFHEIEKSSLIAKPTISLINNVGHAHIELLGSRAGLLKAKLEILSGMDKKVLVVNNDNDLLHYYSLNNDTITFGIENISDYMCSIKEINEYYSIINYKNTLIKIPVGGIHFIYNALAAITISELLFIPIKNIKNGLETCELTKGRSEVIKCDGYEIINDAYNANVDAMKYAIKYLSIFKGRKIAVLGTMGELGEIVNDAHYQIGVDLAKSKIDVLITVGEYTSLINDGAIKNGLKKEDSYHLDNKEDAIKLLKSMIKQGDTILVKASHFNNFIEIVNQIK